MFLELKNITFVIYSSFNINLYNIIINQDKILTKQ
jgi:hypothetical protein